MTRTIPITQAREELTTIVDNAKRKSERYDITVNGIRAAVLMSADEYDAWEETNEILSDKELMESIRRGEQDLQEGKVIPWEEVEKELDLD